MIKSVYSIAVMVRDGKRAAKWYREKFGFKQVDRMEHWITVAPKGSKMLIHLCEVQKEWGTKLEPGNSGLAMVTDNLDKTYKELTAKGVVFKQKPMDRGWGKYAIVKDPDNNEFTLYE